MGNLFSWGKGGGGGGDMAMPAMPQQDNTAMYMEMMGGMMEGLMGMAEAQQASQQTMMDMQMQTQMPAMPAQPLPERAPEIDWTEKQGQLNQKMKADWTAGNAQKKGRLGTVLTSPLLDEEDASVTGSVLASDNAGGNQ